MGVPRWAFPGGSSQVVLWLGGGLSTPLPDGVGQNHGGIITGKSTSCNLRAYCNVTELNLLMFILNIITVRDKMV